MQVHLSQCTDSISLLSVWIKGRDILLQVDMHCRALVSGFTGWSIWSHLSKFSIVTSWFCFQKEKNVTSIADYQCKMVCFGKKSCIFTTLNSFNLMETAISSLFNALLSISMKLIHQDVRLLLLWTVKGIECIFGTYFSKK